MIASGVQALVIAPADSRALVPVVKRAQQAGIVVVNIDNKLDAETLTRAGLTVPFVGPDNREGARLVVPRSRSACTREMPWRFWKAFRRRSTRSSAGSASRTPCARPARRW